MSRMSRTDLLAVPGIGIALLPKLACPLCWPLYAGILSSLGLGFLIGTTYLLPLTAVFLALPLAVLGFRARRRRGYGPLLLGVAGSAAVLIGKFQLEMDVMIYGGVGALVMATLWSAMPRPAAQSCSCQ